MKTVIIPQPNRIRRIEGGFSFIPHCFLTGGFFKQLKPHQKLLYFFLVLAADKNGVSYYKMETIQKTLELEVFEVDQAINGLIDLELIAYQSPFFQVLHLSKNESVVFKEPNQPRGLKVLPTRTGTGFARLLGSINRSEK